MIERIDHTAIVVHDLDESIKFYTETLGLIVDRMIFDMPGARLAFLKKEGAEIELLEFDDPAIPPGFRHIAMKVSNIEDFCADLESKGAEVVKKPRKLPTGQIVAIVRDPNGVTIELLDR